MDLVLIRLAGHKVPVRDGYCSKPVLGHGLDDCRHQPILVGGGEALNLAAVPEQEAALLHDYLGGSLGVHTVASALYRDNCAHRLSGGVESVHFLKSCIWHLASQLKQIQITY